MSPIHRTEPLAFRFYASDTGSEPVRVWLDALSKEVRNRIGTDMRKVQVGWPLVQTSSYVGSFGRGLWEVRSTHDGNDYRVLFCVNDETLVALHGLQKTTQKTPDSDIALGRTRMSDLTTKAKKGKKGKT